MIISVNTKDYGFFLRTDTTNNSNKVKLLVKL